MALRVETLPPLETEDDPFTVLALAAAATNPIGEVHLRVVVDLVEDDNAHLVVTPGSAGRPAGNRRRADRWCADEVACPG